VHENNGQHCKIAENLPGLFGIKCCVFAKMEENPWRFWQKA
jgi:hypothetical protein